MNPQSDNYGQIDESSDLHRAHLERMIQYYDQTAAQYNQWHCDPTNESSHNFAVREILQTMKDLDARSVLDVCCGTGRAVRAALDSGYAATTKTLISVWMNLFSVYENILIR